MAKREPMTPEQLAHAHRILGDIVRAMDGDAPALRWDAAGRRVGERALARLGLEVVNTEGAAACGHYVRRNALPVVRGETFHPHRWESLFLLNVQTAPSKRARGGKR